MKKKERTEEWPSTEKKRIAAINRLNGEVMEYFKESLRRAIQIGELLHDEVSRLLPLTDELNLSDPRVKAWIKRNCPFNHRTALNYIDLHWQGQSLKEWLDSLTVFDLIVAYRLMMEHKRFFGSTFRKNGKV